jgi:hypothetical protein
MHASQRINAATFLKEASRNYAIYENKILAGMQAPSRNRET